VNPEVPEGISAVAVRLLARDPEDRYQSAAELIEDLKRVNQGEYPASVAQQAASPLAGSDPGGRSQPQEPSGNPTDPAYPVSARTYGGRPRRVLVAAMLIGVMTLVVVGIIIWVLVS
jgi:serine/threonine-protein kinase